MKIFPTIVTTAYNHSFSNYLEKIKEADVLGIRELCSFPIIALELENSLEEQLRAKRYIKKIVNGL